MAFTPDELKKHIQDTLNLTNNTLVPNGHRGAFVTYFDEAGVRTAIAVKTDKGWEIQGSLGWHTQDKGLDYGVNVMKTW